MPIKRRCKIQEMSKDIGRRAKNLRCAAPRIHDQFEDNFLEYIDPSQCVQLSNDLQYYFDCQEKMIKELIGVPETEAQHVTMSLHLKSSLCIVMI